MTITYHRPPERRDVAFLPNRPRFSAVTVQLWCARSFGSPCTHRVLARHIERWGNLPPGPPAERCLNSDMKRIGPLLAALALLACSEQFVVGEDDLGQLDDAGLGGQGSST